MSTGGSDIGFIESSSLEAQEAINRALIFKAWSVASDILLLTAYQTTPEGAEYLVLSDKVLPASETTPVIEEILRENDKLLGNQLYRDSYIAAHREVIEIIQTINEAQIILREKNAISGLLPEYIVQDLLTLNHLNITVLARDISAARREYKLNSGFEHVQASILYTAKLLSNLQLQWREEILTRTDIIIRDIELLIKLPRFMLGQEESITLSTGTKVTHGYATTLFDELIENLKVKMNIPGYGAALSKLMTVFHIKQKELREAFGLTDTSTERIAGYNLVLMEITQDDHIKTPAVFVEPKLEQELKEILRLENLAIDLALLDISVPQTESLKPIAKQRAYEPLETQKVTI